MPDVLSQISGPPPLTLGALKARGFALALAAASKLIVGRVAE